MSVYTEKLIRVSSGRIAALTFACAIIVLTALHLRIHAGLLANPWPITVREAAFILQTDALLDPAAPAMYSVESTPGQTNLYGPLYPLMASPLAALLPDQPYLAHRLTVSLFLFGTCILLGLSAAKEGGRVAGLIAGGLYYAATVATPSLAAGPDTLATFLYVAAIVVFRRLGPSIGGIAAVIPLGLLALLAKPYAVWVLPCMIVYVTWAHSIRRGAGAAIATTMVVAAGAWTINFVWPEYFFSVLQIHSASATRFASVLREQIIEFSWLNFAFLALFLILLPYRNLAKKTLQWKWHAKSQAPLTDDHATRWPIFMTVGASLPLLISMGWHGGAHLIYFNHLLLPPLLLAALSLQAQLKHIRSHSLANILVLANIIVLIIFVPPLPQAPENFDLSTAGSMLVDPVLEPVLRLHSHSDVVDNAQTEYWIFNAKQHGNQERKSRAEAWELDLIHKLNNQYYDTILLTSPYTFSRPALLTKDTISEPLALNYVYLGKNNMYIYYLPFRQRAAYGKIPVSLLVFSKKKSFDPQSTLGLLNKK